MELVERCRTREALADLLAQACRGNGRAALISGAPGMGKTTLIQDIQSHADAAGALVLSAVACAEERGLPMGVVGQLFRSVTLAPQQSGQLAGLLQTLGAGALPERDAVPRPGPIPTGVADGVNRLVHQLAEHTPLVITVDDVQESDPASLQCLLYTVRRIDSARILVVLGERTEVPGTGLALTAEFVRNARGAVIPLGPLSPSETSALVTARLGPHTDPAVAARWHEASGGSPLLLRALLEDHGGASPPGGEPPVAGRAFALAVRFAVLQLGEEPLRVARGLAVLGDAASPALLDRLLALPHGGAAQALAALDTLGLTRDGRYRLAPAGTAVLAEMPPGHRAGLCRRAAEVLHEEGAPASAVAEQLVAGGSCGADWSVATLREAAAQALLHSDPEGALRFLRVAHDACQDPALQAEVRAELAQAEWEVDPATVHRYLGRLMEDHRQGRTPPGRSLRLIGYLLWHGRPDWADEILGGLVAEEDRLDEATRVHLGTVLVWYAYWYPQLGARYGDNPAFGDARLGRAAGTVDPQSGGARLLSSLLAEGPNDGALEAAEQLLQGVVLHEPPIAPAVAALASLVRAAQLDGAAAWCSTLLQGAERRTPTARAILLAASATVESRRGNAEAARRHADEALTLLSPMAWGVAITLPLSAKVLACIAQGDREGAAACFRVPVPDMAFQTLSGLHYLQARGRYHLELGHHHAALGDFFACRDLMAAWRLDLSACVPWRIHAVEALIALDSPARAKELLADELAGQGPENGPARARALHLSERLGTPPEPPLGPESDRDPVARLSRAEQRVAVLATQGCTNRQIAEKLYVTTSTVEQHLTRTYHKLGVRNRAELSAVLEPPVSA
ncbi:AAA family ATPase [Streptomyces sp. NPDC052496]|uniref:AAA family ATPase n=1 Tax=Streptomyces sp. NPDC052496 TaxID=3154951 RepID=UPI00343EB92A